MYPPLVVVSFLNKNDFELAMKIKATRAVEVAAESPTEVSDSALEQPLYIH